MILKDLISILEFFYPKDLAYDWDNVGLLIGDRNTEVNGVLTALEITQDVALEAIERECNVIVCHHPLIFKPMANFDYSDPHVRLIKTLIQHDIAVYAMHTNVDIAANGMNDWLCDLLGVKNTQILSQTTVKNYYKLSIETTQAHLFDCIEVLKTTSVGQKGKKIQNYNITPQVKYFKDIDKEQQVKDVLILDSYFKKEDLNEIKSKLFRNKIYNYQIIEIDNLTNRYGLGRVGSVKPTSLEGLATKIKEVFQIPAVSVVGSRESEIAKVAITGGSGSSMIVQAKRMGADVLITGDVGFHDAQLALSHDICLIDAGHNIEIIFNDYMADFIHATTEIRTLASEIDTNPFEVV